jgi:hypothetical protein
MVLAGEIFRTSDLRQPRVYTEKTTNQIKTNNTLADDNELFSPMLTNSSYLFEVVLFYTTASSNTPDLKIAFTWPAGCTASWFALGLDVGAGSTTGSIQVNAYSETTTSGSAVNRGATNGGNTGLLIRGRIKTTSTSGNLRLQFAQVTTTAENTTVIAGSHMIVEKVA